MSRGGKGGDGDTRGGGGENGNQNNKGGNDEGGNEIEVPSMEELDGLADKIADEFVSQGMKIYQTLDPETRPYPDEYREGLRSQVEELPEKFKEFYTPGPGEFTAKLDLIDELTRKLDTQAGDFNTGEISGHVHDAMDNMGEWEGALSISFRKGYLDPLYEGIIPNHGRVLALLHDNFQAMRDIYAEGRKSLKKIGEDGLSAMEQADDVDGAAVVTALTVLAAAFGLGFAGLAAVPGIATAAGVAGAAVAGGLAVASDQAPEPEEIPLAGSSAEDVLVNIYDALSKLEDDILTKEAELIDTILRGCDETLELVGDTTENSMLVPKMPDLVGTALDDYHQISEGLNQFD
ncbi:hypothetical protein [Stackebrandtia nassauensis]|uniref:Uncharacterized protein n=1 Tax=Stackebrandtia nassauensis (strain DSM 44728 / CIP 108903 / NRRL B-16338 / NBRC 102104 / LLR-40K-21) TaxID=446470 RepID=D3PV43_STANL|nr:hypothetical protein [Stackebrandtia nassauensis]ADD41096.1 hypothetical protein Snas_1389 [Stackebrandtia nassauensis DSM 44728]